jgi:hypothetical protein
VHNYVIIDKKYFIQPRIDLGDKISGDSAWISTCGYATLGLKNLLKEWWGDQS